jgi:glutaredoxin
MAKEFFTANGVSYTEHNVAEDTDQRAVMVEKSGQMGVPVILIGDEMVIGFNEGKLKELLGL